MTRYRKAGAQRNAPWPYRRGHVSGTLIAQQVGAHHGRGGERDDHGNENGGGQSDGKFAEETADDAAHQKKRNEDGDERNADGEDGEADLLCAVEGGGEGVHAGFEMAGDVFHDHDGVIDDEAGGDGERHQREIVEAVAAEIHDREGADERDGHGDGRDERGAAVAQEDEDHEDDQNDRNDERAFDVADGGPDGGGAVENDGGIDALRDGGLDGRQLGANAIDGVDDVGAGLAEDDEHDGALAVQVARGADVLHGIDDVGDIGEANGGAVVVADDERAGSRLRGKSGRWPRCRRWCCRR